MTITSKRNFRFYFQYAIISPILFGFQVFLLYKMFVLWQKSPTFGTYFGLILMLLLSICAFFPMYKYLRKYAQKVTMNAQYISFGRKKYRLDDIKKIVLKGKTKSFPFVMEAATISFNDGTEKYLADDIYANISEMKSFLEQVVINKQPFHYKPTQKVAKNVLRFENEEHFKAHPVLSWNGFLIWVMIIGIWSPFFIIGGNPLPEMFLFFGGLSLFPLILLIIIMYYFGITKNYFVVRNHYLFWRVKIYRLEDIREVVFEITGKLSNRVRIITNDFQSDTYLVSLSDKVLRELKTRLEANNISVRAPLYME